MARYGGTKPNIARVCAGRTARDRRSGPSMTPGLRWYSGDVSTQQEAARYGFVIPTGDPRPVAELAHQLEEAGGTARSIGTG